MMNTSLSAPPEARRWDEDLWGLKFRPVTGPWCRPTEATYTGSNQPQQQHQRQQQAAVGGRVLGHITGDGDGDGDSGERCLNE